MSTKLEQKSIQIGDIGVYYDEGYVQITVDGDTAIFMRRSKENGLEDLVNSLKELIKD